MHARAPLESPHAPSRASPRPVTPQLAGSDIKSAKWYENGSTATLWVTDAGGTLHRFSGPAWRSADQDTVSTRLKQFGVTLEKGRTSTKGRNFVALRLSAGALELVGTDGGVVVPIPLAQMGMVALPSGTEVEVQCLDDDTMEKEDECLLEMRLVIPEGLEVSGLTKRPPPARSASAEGEEEEEEGGETTATALHRAMTARATVSGDTSKPLVEVPAEYGSFLVPRGRFGIAFHSAYLRLINPSYEFKISYKSIARITYLPLPIATGTWREAKRYVLVISLDDPLRQGASRHPHLVLQADDKQVALDLSIPPEDVEAGKYDGLGKEASTIESTLPKLLGQLLKKITGKPVYKAESFESASQQRAVRCTHKASNGFFYPLERSCMFVHKPTVWIKYSDVEGITVERYAGTGSSSARTFDLIIRCRAGGGESVREYLFQGLDRAERDPLVFFFKSKNVAVKDDGAEKAAKYTEEEEEEEEEEEDEGDYGSDDAEKEEKKAKQEEGDDEEEEEEEEESASDDGFKRKRKGKGKAAPPAKKAKKAPKKKKAKRKGSSEESGSDSD